MNECEYCSVNFDSYRKLNGHKAYCKEGPYRQSTLQNRYKSENPKIKLGISKNEQIKRMIVAKDSKAGPFVCKFCNKEMLKYNSLLGHVQACNKNPNRSFVCDHTGFKTSEETKKRLSDTRKAYIAANPDKAIFNYKKSKAEDILAKYLDEKNIKYIQQFNDKRWNRGFAVDFLLLNSNIILEVNGAFKYIDGILDDYYINRQKIIESVGYKVIQIYYSKVYNREYLDNILVL